MLASMSESGLPTETLNWSDLGMTELPTGTVSLLLADIEGSTGLWETDSDAMTAAVARLDRTLSELVGAHRGVRPVEQGEGDSFVVAFTRPATQWHARSTCSARHWNRFGCGSAFTPARYNFATKAITSGRRSTELRDCGSWRTGGQVVLSGVAQVLVGDTGPTGCPPRPSSAELCSCCDQ